ncbi:hypothetical protein SAMN04489712_111265 [Thermomonospora echinospora]|uniref:Uncharacterized protein n=1 Tax=Thermomonospora echinospora TaxID=1992 RepID=A0A1H6CXU8_9ACTN|nr:hypothetical protein [Thermomonospora echinospora]SEG77216.1 hypothetical protein SAMN04489712_111265 [Thermomonospora echinospora]
MTVGLEFTRRVPPVRLVAVGGGAATLELDIRDELRRQNDLVHGGVLTYAGLRPSSWPGTFWGDGNPPRADEVIEAERGRSA